MDPGRPLWVLVTQPTFDAIHLRASAQARLIAWESYSATDYSSLQATLLSATRCYVARCTQTTVATRLTPKHAVTQNIVTTVKEIKLRMSINEQL